LLGKSVTLEIPSYLEFRLEETSRVAILAPEMKLWWQLSAKEKLKRTEWTVGVGTVLILVLGFLWSPLWFFMLIVLFLGYIGTQLHIKNQLAMERKEENNSSRD